MYNELRARTHALGRISEQRHRCASTHADRVSIFLCYCVRHRVYICVYYILDISVSAVQYMHTFKCAAGVLRALCVPERSRERSHRTK